MNCGFMYAQLTYIHLMSIVMGISIGLLIFNIKLRKIPSVAIKRLIKIMQEIIDER